MAALRDRLAHPGRGSELGGVGAQPVWGPWSLARGGPPEENRTEDPLVIYERQDGADDEPSEVRVMAISPVSGIRTDCPINVIVARTIEGQIVSTREPSVDCNVDWIIEFPAAPN